MKMINVLVTSCLIGGVAGCASSEITQGASRGHELYPLTPGGAQYFAVDWQPGERTRPPGRTGTLTDRYGATAARVELLVAARDDSASVRSHKVVWLGDSIAPFSYTYFEIPVEQSPKYRVRPFAFDWRGRAGP